MAGNTCLYASVLWIFEWGEISVQTFHAIFLQGHLVGLDEPASGAGQEALLKQEHAKVTRLQRQAEEFLNAVFYRKGWFQWQTTQRLLVIY